MTLKSEDSQDSSEDDDSIYSLNDGSRNYFDPPIEKYSFVLRVTSSPKNKHGIQTLTVPLQTTAVLIVKRPDDLDFFDDPEQENLDYSRKGSEKISHADSTVSDWKVKSTPGLSNASA